MTVAGLDVREIPLAKLVRAEWNANVVPDETLAKVRHSVETFGVVENLVVRPHPEQRGKFEVLSGNHRLALYAELGHSTTAEPSTSVTRTRRATSCDKRS